MKRPAETLTPSEVNLLISKLSRRYPSGLRGRALIAVLYRTGLRLAEVLALRPKDLSDDGVIRVLHGKGDKARTVSMDEQAFAVLDHWLAARRKLGINGSAPVFCTLRGKPIHQSQIREFFARLGRKAGLDRRIHAHGLRHTFAAELAKENTPINVISKALGHSSSATTARYIDHIAPTDVIDTMKNREWAVA